MKILALEIEVNGVRDEQFTMELLVAEAKRAWELYQEGTIREINFCQDHYTAVLILECENSAEAQRIIDSLPLVKEKLIGFKILPLVPYDGFARLFKQED
jgi:muconolactone delta-isomerase